MKAIVEQRSDPSDLVCAVIHKSYGCTGPVAY